MNEEELKQVIATNNRLREILNIVNELNLTDCWLCAGTIRNFIWNYLSGENELDQSNDVDVVFYDPSISYEETVRLEAKLKTKYPEFQWELKNEVYMHSHNPGTTPYTSSMDALSKFPETCTAIAVALRDDKINLLAPYGISDMVNFVVRATPFFKESTARMAIYRQRVAKKNWQKRWSKIQVLDLENRDIS
ncbi:hypothetical protein IGI37_001691 [Enterococcus sp. AZ194]|uniref:nucleotidyltransferase family protein n=1 Tax=Enterococcus sp. AZ194 TaxID=2774629 RepID=UPI003F253764